ncbi:Guanylate-binding protein 6 [Galemys pyrenaicus]|uniref:Guanylate-binding protein 6 n=1 Tax=Galemys pyrenaicus TaxID=202257 RepID=A0A8J6AEV8_GALPY|nr:Guanylate-binding protein 6 [Galemys pyrenaicus]
MQLPAASGAPGSAAPAGSTRLGRPPRHHDGGGGGARGLGGLLGAGRGGAAVHAALQSRPGAARSSGRRPLTLPCAAAAARCGPGCAPGRPGRASGAQLPPALLRAARCTLHAAAAAALPPPAPVRRCSRLPAPGSRLPAPGSRLPAPGSLPRRSALLALRLLPPPGAARAVQNDAHLYPFLHCHSNKERPISTFSVKEGQQRAVSKGSEAAELLDPWCYGAGWQDTMASGPNMMAPICLVENNNGQLSVKQEATQILEKISQPVVVVAIVGLYRTGKSYLMNRLAGQNHGFPLGSTVQSQTKGIWMWCVPHPSKPNHTLVLLDTEGLGDVEKGDTKNDSWIFALAVLLCSSLVYNSMGTINHQALEQLQYPCRSRELTNLIRSKSSPSSDEVNDSTEFVSFFPDFIWTIRDFTLELKRDDRNISADEYLDNALKLIPGKSPNAPKCNLPREYIRHFFPKRKCFVFDRPTHDRKLLANIEKVSENQLDPKFQEQASKFCSYIFSNARSKTLREGITATGICLNTLVVTYVDTINSGAVPCLEDAVTTLARLENSAVVQKAADHYSQQMAQRVSFPTDTLQELLDMHVACEREATAIFMEHSFKDENQEFQKNLVVTINNKKEELLLQNVEASEKYCRAQLDQLAKNLMENISAGAFSVPGGHKRYIETKERLEQDYWQVPRKGVKAKEVLQSFLQSQAATEKAILQADRALSDAEKDIAEERARKEAAEKKQELLKQRLEEQRQQMEAQKRSLQENVAQLEEKLKLERANLLREQNMMLEHKLKIQEELSNEGQKKKSAEMDTEINLLKNKIDKNRNDETSWMSKTVDQFIREIISVVFDKCVDSVVKGVRTLFQKK